MIFSFQRCKSFLARFCSRLFLWSHLSVGMALCRDRREKNQRPKVLFNFLQRLDSANTASSTKKVLTMFFSPQEKVGREIACFCPIVPSPSTLLVWWTCGIGWSSSLSATDFTPMESSAKRNENDKLSDYWLFLCLWHSLCRLFVRPLLLGNWDWEQH